MLADPIVEAIIAADGVDPRQLLVSLRKIAPRVAQLTSRPGIGKDIMKDIRGIVAWLDDGARSASGPEGLIEELCSRLAGAGIPLERASIFVTMLHPDIAGLGSIWRRGRPVELSEAAYDLVRSDAFLAAPHVWVQRTGTALRRRLDDDAVAVEFPFLGTLRGEGFTDYFATPLHFTNGEIHVASWAARQPADFTDEDVGALTAVARPLARLIEIRSLRRTEATLLDT